MDIQSKIDSITWYHEFDFGNGYVARDKTTNAITHRQLWKFIEDRLDRLDFEGKSVLDIGCWDGYWSFYAEKRGARYVLATDDSEQNKAGGAGFHLARELLKSNVAFDLHQSVYDLTKIGKTFDVILFLGVYYHLVDPFYALAQIRHCCHDETVVIVEGDVLCGLGSTPPQGCAYYSDRVFEAPRFVPEPMTLKQLIRGAYFEVLEEDMHVMTEGIGVNRLLLKCRPWSGENEYHYARAPFGLDAYDPRHR